MDEVAYRAMVSVVGEELASEEGQNWHQTVLVDK